MQYNLHCEVLIKVAGCVFNDLYTSTYCPQLGALHLLQAGRSGLRSTVTRERGGARVLVTTYQPQEDAAELHHVRVGHGVEAAHPGVEHRDQGGPYDRLL